MGLVIFEEKGGGEGGGGGGCEGEDEPADAAHGAVKAGFGGGVERELSDERDAVGDRGMEEPAAVTVAVGDIDEGQEGRGEDVGAGEFRRERRWQLVVGNRDLRGANLDC